MTLPLSAMHWFATHHGVASRHQLLRLGASPTQIDRRVTSGHLVVVHRGVYRAADWPDTETTRCVAACVACPGAAVSHTTAGRLWGLRRCQDDTIHVVVANRRHPTIAGAEIHRSSMLDRNDVVRRPDGIVLTSPLRTACDLSALLSDGDLASVIEQVLHEHRVQYRTLRRTAERVMRPGRAGSGRLRAVLDGRPAGAAAQHSHGEVEVAAALVGAGLPAPVRQMPVTILPGIDVHPDLAFPDVRLVIEIDHLAWHTGDQIALDKRRDRLVKLAGYDTVRLSDDDLRRRFTTTIDEVAAIYRQLARRTRRPLAS